MNAEMNGPVSHVGAGGNILLIDFSGGIFTVPGASPKIPDGIIDDLIRFLQDDAAPAREIANSRPQAEAIIEAPLETEAPGENGLVCN